MIKTILISLRQLLITRLNLLFYLLAFMIPIIISYPQWLTGTVVNCLFFLTAQKFFTKSVLPIVVLPSLGAISYGVLFGVNTIFLFYFLPFIWLGNYILIVVFIQTRIMSYWRRVIIASLLKFSILFIFAKIYFGLKIVPELFITTMGLIQLLTALAGGVLAYFVIKFFRINNYE
jgi:hypothetical protein